MNMEEARTTTSYSSVVSEFEGMLLTNEDLFSYFMLLAFDSSGGLIRFTILLFLWPIIALLDVFGYQNVSTKVMVFVATVGLREKKMVSAAKTVLPKFYMDDLSMETWRIFGTCKNKVVVTRMPRVMVEWFAKEHLGADDVIGTELILNRFGFFTGLIQETDIDQSILNGLGDLFVHGRPRLGLGRASTTFLSLCEEQIHEPVQWNNTNQKLNLEPPKQVIFNDGILVKRPTPLTSLFIILWFPFGIVLGTIRIIVCYIFPVYAAPYILAILGGGVVVKGTPPPRASDSNGGLLFVCNHRTFIDPLMVSFVLRRNVPAVVTFKISKLFHVLSPVTMVLFTRNRDVDAVKMKEALSKGDLVVCPEGCTCNEPFVLRFSAMFAELTDKIMPVAINCRGGLLQAGERCNNRLMRIVLLSMNPTVVYEVTFLDQLPLEDTCSSGRSSYDVANHVQRSLADTLGFQCTNLGRKDCDELIG
ncbi:unnamed protein product [Cochlearia groenlandica]